jgi:hypothetical protein
MSDPIQELRNLAQQGADVTPLPAPEVRRRGDRMRRRQHVLAAVAGVAAVALIATPIAVLASGSDKAAPGLVGTPPATTSPTATTSPAQTDAPHDIPDGFPLAAGWPDPSTSEYGDEALKGPNRTLPPLDLSACGNKVPDPGDTDRLNATWTNVEDYRGRELMTFSTAQEAVTYVAHLRAVWADCPVEESGDGDIRRQLRATSVGGESVALISTYEYAGKPALGLGINHVIRLGRAVLVDATSNEGTESAIDDQLARMTAASAPVVDAMCVFTQAGC